ncbi:hypothetical protein VTH06DRAFT_8766 [Thermothelomyces fergusii]
MQVCRGTTCSLQLAREASTRLVIVAAKLRGGCAEIGVGCFCGKFASLGYCEWLGTASGQKRCNRTAQGGTDRWEEAKNGADRAALRVRRGTTKT